MAQLPERAYRGSLKTPELAAQLSLERHPAFQTSFTSLFTMFRMNSIVLAFGALVACVAADHTITVHNRCGYGTPTMYGPSSAAPFKKVSPPASFLL
jgi:hypothetical protein